MECSPHPLSGPFLVNTTTAGDQRKPQVSPYGDNNFVVVWEDLSATGGDTSGNALRAQRFDASGQRLGTELLVNTTTAGDQTDAVVAPTGTGFAVAWVDRSGADADVHAQVFSGAGGRTSAELQVGEPAGEQTQVQIASRGGMFMGSPGPLYQSDYGFALAWSSDTDGLPGIDAIRVAAFSTSGTQEQGQAFTLATQGTGLRGLVDMAGHGFSSYTVAWTDGDGLADRHVVGRFSFGINSPVLEVSRGPAGLPEDLRLAPDNAQGPGGDPVARTVFDAAANQQRLVIGNFHASLADDGVVRTATGPGAFTVLDAGMTSDGRVVVLTREADGSIALQLADGRGSQFYSNTGPAFVLGNDGPNEIYTAVWNDTVYGLGGSDYLHGWAGNDVLVGGGGADILIGDSGNDTVYGGEDADHVSGGTGTNVIVGDGGVDVLFSSGKDDTL
ncbi:MAG TPA: hypothetical protein VHL79_06770, partial [Ramlibacter sp.]|nr:hypothetical protein [Ramlibacter sp.]